jgi:hypothetical protein
VDSRETRVSFMGSPPGGYPSGGYPSGEYPSGEYPSEDADFPVWCSCLTQTGWCGTCAHCTSACICGCASST